MKWFLAFIAIPLMALTAYGQTQVVVTGNVSGATSGTVTFSLSPWSSGVHYYVPSVTTIAGQNQTCSINGSGAVVATNGGSCLVWGNDVIAPANTTYNVTFAPSGRVSNTVPQENITGSAYNLNSPVFAPKVTLIPQYNSLISNPAAFAVNVVPVAPHAYTVGLAGDSYANGYFDNLTGGSINYAKGVFGTGAAETCSGLSITDKFDQTSGFSWQAGNVPNIVACIQGQPILYINNNGIGVGTGAAANLQLSTDVTQNAWTLSGVALRIDNNTYTDTTSTGTVADDMVTVFDEPIMAASNVVTYTLSPTVYIQGPPQAGTNVTITNPLSFLVGSGNSEFNGNLSLGGNPKFANFTIAQGGSFPAWGNNGVAIREQAVAFVDTTSTGTIPFAAINGLAASNLVANSATTYTTASNLYIAGPPIASTNVTITHPLALLVATGNSQFSGNVGIGTVVGTANLAINQGGLFPAWGVNGIAINEGTVTFTDTSSSGTVAAVAINGIAASNLQASSATTYTNASTFYISGAPSPATNATFTNKYALYVDNNGGGGPTFLYGPVTSATSFEAPSMYASGVGGFSAQDGGIFAFTSSTDPTATKDTGLSRLGAGIIALGNGTVGDYSGRLQLTQLNVASGGSTTISSGAGSILMSTANPLANSAWIPIYYQGTKYYVPGWTTNAP